jgi:hypothetical protein
MVDFLVSQGAVLTPFETASFGKLDRFTENQAADSRRHTPIVTEEGRPEIQPDCASIAGRLRQELHAV